MAIEESRVGRRKLWRVLALAAALASAPAVAEVAERLPRGERTTETAVEIPDAVLRHAVAAALGKVAGDPITRGEMATLDSLVVRGVEQLAGIEHAIDLNWLQIEDGAVSNLTPLSGLRSLRSLYLGDNAIVNVDALSGLTSLVELGLWGNKIADISPLSGLRSLRSIYLSDNAIVNVEALSGLTSLVELGLWGNKIADVGRLSGLTSLTYLSLGDNGIADVSPLVGMRSLTTLRLGYNAIVDIEPLSGMTSLVRLYLSGNEIADVGPLSALMSVETLGLEWNRVTDISPLVGMRSLTTLRLGYNAIADIEPLAGMTSLVELYLSGNKIADISPLSGLRSLRSLYLGDNAIVNVEALSGLTALVDLGLGYNEIADVGPLSALMSVETLGLERNRVTDISPLAGMRSLTTLRLGYNAIADIEPLAGMTSLVELYLSGNEIADVGPLSGLMSVETLGLDRNRVTDIWPLAGLGSLTALDLAYNEIADVGPLVENTGLGNGDFVGLEGNWLSARSIETHIPQLLQRGVEVEFAEFAELPELPDAALRRAGEWALYTFRDEPESDDLGSLKSLDASDRGVEDLTGLEGAVSLRGLFLDRNKITDISPLASLGSLNVLTLTHNRVEDWSPLAGMDLLDFLALDGNALNEIPPLPRGLRYLYLADNALSGIGALGDMWDLVELDVSGNAITSLEPLAGQGQLRYLHVHDNEVTDISRLNFEPLRELHMANNAVRDISPLLDGEALLMVDVRGNPLADDALPVLDTFRERRVTVLAGEAVPYFPAAGEGRQGFVRIMNHSDEAGHAFIEAVDDSGVRAGPVRLELGARQAVHFNSADLEYGSAAKGLAGIGAPTAGDWRLSVISALDVEVLSYIRTEDGFVTAMHDVAADAMAPFFNPGSNRNQRSILRVVNTEAEPAKWTTGGYDDRGSWHPMTGSLLVRPQHALMLTAQELEDAHGLGDGSGKWRLRVRGFPWFAMSLLESPTGHLTNLSTAPAHTTLLEDGAAMHRLPLFPAAGGGRQGFARVINRSYTSGEVTIWAVDDAGTRSGPVRLTMRPRRVVHFNSADLEGGNAGKGLEGSLGIGEGDWRLEITSKLDLMALAYVRTTDGFLTSLHDLAPVAEGGSHRVVFFNPGSNTRQVSKLRLINDGEQGARVTIAGIDDQGNGSGRVARTVPAGSTLTFTAAELEAGGERVSGSLGDGEGKWRLRVASDAPIAVMSLLETPSGHLTNMSTGTAD